MSKLVRFFESGQTCFITSVTGDRRRLLHSNSGMLGHAVRRALEKSRFAIIAWVVLPDHVHAVLQSPNGDLSKIVQRIKLSFSKQLRRLPGESGPVWQHRYWDHIIRSDRDLVRHVDYIHYNPVKHGLVASPVEWPLSSYHRYRHRGYYGPDWGEQPISWGESAFGE
jgi:putative transposase